MHARREFATTREAKEGQEGAGRGRRCLLPWLERSGNKLWLVISHSWSPCWALGGLNAT